MFLISPTFNIKSILLNRRGPLYALNLQAKLARKGRQKWWQQMTVKTTDRNMEEKEAVG